MASVQGKDLIDAPFPFLYSRYELWGVQMHECRNYYARMSVCC